MITVLTGDNDYLIKNQLDLLISDFNKKNGDLAVEKYQAEDIDIKSLSQSLNSSSLFADSKLIVLDQPSLNKEFVQNFETILSSVPDETAIVIIDPSVDKRSSFYKFLTKQKVINCSKLGESELLKWVTSFTREIGGSISTEDAKYLIERVGDNQTLLSHEIEKLTIYDQKITKTNIDLLTVESPASTVFQLLDATFSGQVSKALSIYDKQRLSKVAPEQIMAMFSWQLHLIALSCSAKNISFNDQLKLTKASPYSLKKSAVLADKVSLVQVGQVTSDLLNIDYSSKTLNYNLDHALKNFITETSVTFS